MFKKISYYLYAFYLFSPLAALAQPRDELCQGVGSARGGGGCPEGSALGRVFERVANTLIFIVGAVSVLMIIIGGLRYVLSAGDPASTKAAKDTVLYAVIGVIVAIIAFAIVGFVANNIGRG